MSDIDKMLDQAAQHYNITPSAAAPIGSQPPPNPSDDWKIWQGGDAAATPQAPRRAESMTGRDRGDKPQLSVPGQVADLMEGTGKYSSGALLPAFAAAPGATLLGIAAGAGGQQVGQHGAEMLGATPDQARLAGDVLGFGAGAAASAIPGAVARARTPNPDIMMGKALNPHPADVEFKKYIPQVRENMQRGAEITQKPITDVDSAIEATNAAMKEHMDALEAHKENARRVQAKMPTSLVKFKQIAAIPEGLELRDPEAYNEAINEINGQFKGTPYLNTDQVFDQAILNNNQLSAYHAGKPGAQATKLITNSGDTATLKAAGDAYRQWIAENLGPAAADINKSWGELNGTKHYLEAKVNPSFLQQPASPAAGMMDAAGIHPGQSLRHSLVQGVAGKIAGVPSNIDPMLAAAFKTTAAADPPWTPNQTPFRLEAPPDQSGPIYNPLNNSMLRNPKLLPAASSQVGVSGTTVPDILGRSTRGTGSSGRPLLPAPAPGQPPLNVQPSGPGSIGPAGSVPVRSSETPRPAAPIGSGDLVAPPMPLGLPPASPRSLPASKTTPYREPRTLPGTTLEGNDAFPLSTRPVAISEPGDTPRAGKPAQTMNRDQRRSLSDPDADNIARRMGRAIAQGGQQ